MNTLNTQIEFAAGVWSQLEATPSVETVTIPGRDRARLDPASRFEYCVANTPLVAFCDLDRVDAADYVDRFDTLPQSIMLLGRAGLIGINTRNKFGREWLFADEEERYEEGGRFSPPNEGGPYPIQLVSITPDGFTEMRPRNVAGLWVNRAVVTASLGFEDNHISNENHAYVYGNQIIGVGDGYSKFGTRLAAARGAMISKDDLGKLRQIRK